MFFYSSINPSVHIFSFLCRVLWVYLIKAMLLIRWTKEQWRLSYKLMIIILWRWFFLNFLLFSKTYNYKCLLRVIISNSRASGMGRGWLFRLLLDDDNSGRHQACKIDERQENVQLWSNISCLPPPLPPPAHLATYKSGCSSDKLRGAILMLSSVWIARQ